MKKRLLWLIVLPIILCYLVYPIMAKTPQTTHKLGEEIPVPESIDFEAHDRCWEHDCFLNFHVRDDGWFIITSIRANQNGAKDQGFDRIYIDIYSENGTWQRELSMAYSDDNTVARLTSDAVEIYCTNYYLSYNLTTQEVTCHYTPENYVKSSGLYKELTQSNQQVREWTYKSKGLPSMYTSLEREKDGNKEKILQYKGTSVHFPNIVPYVLSSIVMVIAIGFIIKKRRTKKQ